MNMYLKRLTTFFQSSRMSIALTLLCLTLVTGCTLITPVLPPVEMSDSMGTAPEAESTADSTAVDGEAWRVLAPGLEWRIFSPEGQPLGQITALRIDPALYTFRAHYRPGEPQTVADWRDSLPEAVALVNANFFDVDNQIVGMLISDGVVSGQAYTGRGGTFAIGVDDPPIIFSNIDSPYQGEAYQQAVQGFPMLVQGGAAAYSNNDAPTRRTAVGIDAQGRVVLLTTPGFGLSLKDLSAFLAGDELALVDAFNLDGGGSTMMSVVVDSHNFLLPSRDPVPAVLAVYPR